MSHRTFTTIRVFLILVVLAFIIYRAYATSAGSIKGRTSTTSAGCSSCHGSSSNSGTSVSITSGSGSFVVAPNSVTTFTITVTNSSEYAAGIDIGAKTDQTGETDAGTLSTVAGGGLQVNGTELTQPSPRTLSGGSCTFQFKWTAPSTPGTYYIRAIANAVNGNGYEDPGDHWNWMPVQAITVSGGSGSVSISAPTGGESWCRSSSHNITWSSSGVTNVKIELSTDGGSSFPTTLIASTSASAGSWSWSVPSNQTLCSTNKVKISDASDPSTSSISPSNFTISDVTAITTQPQTQTICTGQNASFSVSASGASLTYQWRKNSSNISGATSSNFTITNVTSNDAANYDCVVSGACGSPVTSNQATLTVNTTPSISQGPTSQTKCEGDAVSFTVTATGTGLTYQWRKNSSNLSGANTSTYNIPNVASGDAGNYDCVVNGTCNNPQTSSQATLTVNLKPQITQSPSSQTKCEGDAVSFSVTATGAGLYYQWRKNSSNITGATNSTYNILSVSSSDAGQYDCVVNGTCNSAQTSSQATLTINSKPQITQSPTSTTKCEGEAVSLSVTASGTGLTYQWRKNSTNITGAANSTYAIASVVSSDAGNYDCVVNGTCNNPQTSSQATLSVNETPKITQNPSTQTVCVGLQVTFSVVASGTGLTYQWRKNSVNIQNANSSNYIIQSAVSSDAGLYDCVVNGTCNNPQTSSPATLNINNQPVITQNPQSQTICKGNGVTFIVLATAPSITYQWRKNNVNIPNANASIYAIQSVSTSDEGQYDCVINGTCNVPITSSPATLSVNSPPEITKQPQDVNLCDAGTAVFRVQASGTALQYQWQKDGIDLPGQNNDSLVLTNLNTNSNGDYDVVVSGSCIPSLKSNQASLKFNKKPEITQQPMSQTIAVGNSADFSISATGINLTYQWQKNNKTISGQTSNVLHIGSASSTDEADYNCIVTDCCGNVTSDVARLTVSQITSGPILSLSLTSVDFGTVPLDNSKDSLLSGILKNTGTQDLIINEFDFTPVTNEFSIINLPSLPLTIKPGTSLDLKISFKPNSEGTKNVSLGFKSNSPTDQNLNLSGMGGASDIILLETEIKLKSGQIGSPVDGKCTIRNKGNLDAEMTFTITGTKASRFKIIDTDTICKLHPDSLRVVNIEFNPCDMMQADAELEIILKGNPQPLIVKLTGSIIPDLVNDPDNFVSELKTYPNPGNNQINIVFMLEKPDIVNIVIYNLSGEIVKNFGNLNGIPGTNNLFWDGKDDTGIALPAGAYLLTLRHIYSVKNYLIGIVK